MITCCSNHVWADTGSRRVAEQPHRVLDPQFQREEHRRRPNQQRHQRLRQLLPSPRSRPCRFPPRLFLSHLDLLSHLFTGTFHIYIYIYLHINFLIQRRLYRWCHFIFLHDVAGPHSSRANSGSRQLEPPCLRCKLKFLPHPIKSSIRSAVFSFGSGFDGRWRHEIHPSYHGS